MKIFFRFPWGWITAICALLFFSSGIVIRGNALNALSFGILGWTFWISLVVLVLKFFLIPLWEFMRLPKDILSEISEDEKLRIFEAYAKLLLRTENLCSEREKDGFRKALKEIDDKTRISILETNLNDFRNRLQKKSDEIIRRHMKCAALVVIISPRGWMDALSVFAIQIRLIVSLCKFFGYRPSCTFVSCCMVWVLMNSWISALLGGSDITEIGGETFGSVYGANAGTEFWSGIPGLKFFSNQIFQATGAAASVYVTGNIVRNRLLGNTRRFTPKEHLELRLSGMKEALSATKDFLKKFLFKPEKTK